MKYLIIIFSFCVFICGCKKNDTTATVYVSGHLYDSCSGAPVKNRALYLYQQNAQSNSSNTLASGSTDSTGYFKIPYGTTNPVSPIELRLSGGNYAVIRLPAAQLKNIDDLNTYLISTCNIVVKLNVINPYTANDTLEVADLRSQATGATLKVAGPFTSGVLYTAYGYTILLPDIIANEETGISPQGFGYRINNAPIPSTQNYIMKTCATNEVVINIE